MGRFAEMRRQPASVWVQSLLYAAAGVNHLAQPGFYLRIMPDHYAHPGALVAVSGLAEVAGGLGYFVPRTRRLAAVGITTMLLVYLDVHVWMVRHPERFPGVPRWVLWGRIPLQFVLIAWVWHGVGRQGKPKEA